MWFIGCTSRNTVRPRPALNVLPFKIVLKYSPALLIKSARSASVRNRIRTSHAAVAASWASSE
eukprot:1799712-Pyramimonas_sp.AAC.1